MRRSERHTEVHFSKNTASLLLKQWKKGFSSEVVRCCIDGEIQVVAFSLGEFCPAGVLVPVSSETTASVRNPRGIVMIPG